MLIQVYLKTLPAIALICDKSPTVYRAKFLTMAINGDVVIV